MAMDAEGSNPSSISLKKQIYIQLSKLTCHGLQWILAVVVVVVIEVGVIVEIARQVKKKK